MIHIHEFTGTQGLNCENLFSLLNSSFENIAAVVNIAAFALLPIVSATLFICSIDMCVGDTFSRVSWQYSMPVLLSSGTLVKSVNNNITVTERVKVRTLFLRLQ